MTPHAPQPALSAASPLASPAGWVRALRGSRRALVAMALGAVAVPAFPPVSAVPLLIVALVGLVWLLDGAERPRAAFAVGWFFGLGFFALGLYWISHALLVDAARHGWMIPFAVGGLAAVLALFPALACLAARILAWPVAGPGGASRVLGLAACWTLAEWLRGWVFTGFPWNLVAYVWSPVPPVAQGAALVGAFGLSLLTVAVFAMPAVLGDGPRPDDPRPDETRPASRRSWMPVALAAAFLGGVALWGGLRLAAAPPEPVEGVTLRIVQPGIPQELKWDPEHREAFLQRHIAMSRSPAQTPITHVIWAETAAPYSLDVMPERRGQVAGAAPDGGLVLTGAPRFTPPGVEPFQVWNSLFAVTHDGEIAGVYDKAHLVPFGEYVPFRALLPIDRIVEGGADFSPGPGRATLRVPGLPPFSPLICYEAIFPGRVVSADERPHWLLNVTNDGWFGISFGPHQHFAAARMRAVEEGLPLVRAANTGISAVVDAHGRLKGRLGLGVEGVLDLPLPGALPPTPFARTGNLSTLALAAFLLGWAASRRFRKDQR